jgi:uncharacterized protein (DUF3084 family)
MPDRDRYRVYRSSRDYAAELADEVKDLSRRLRERQGANQHLTEELEKRTRWAQGLDERIGELEAQIRQLQGEVAARDARIRDLGSER